MNNPYRNLANEIFRITDGNIVKFLTKNIPDEKVLLIIWEIIELEKYSAYSEGHCYGQKELRVELKKLLRIDNPNEIDI